MSLCGVPMNIPPLSQSPFRLASHASAPDTNRAAQQGSGSALASNSPASAPSRQEALALFERTLTMGYEKLQAKQQGAVNQFAAFEPLTAEKVAGNILGFIERRLQMDAAEGATQEQLQSRLEAGLAGFKKGFAEASEKLKALSMLSPEVKQDIGKTYDLVLTGIDALREKFIGNLPDVKQPPVPEQTTRQQAYGALANSSYQYASASSFSFQLVTAEGDKVTISASATQTFAANYSRGLDRNGQGMTEAMSATYAASRESYWSIQGDLNDDEMRAIEDLLGQVNKLANEFFNGNLDEAFNQALALGYDDKQITSFALHLTQVDVQRVSTAYQQFGDSPVQANLSERLLPLGQFVRDLLDTLNTAARFPEPQRLLADLSERIVAPEEGETVSHGERFRQFVEQVLQSLN